MGHPCDECLVVSICASQENTMINVLDRCKKLNIYLYEELEKTLNCSVLELRDILKSLDYEDPNYKIFDKLLYETETFLCGEKRGWLVEGDLENFASVGEPWSDDTPSEKYLDIIIYNKGNTL